MPAPWLIPAAISAVGAGVEYFGRKKSRRFEDTASGRFLSGIGNTGRYNRIARRNILGQTALVSGAASQRNRAAARGYLQAGGFGGSIAGGALLAEPGLQRQRQLGLAAENIETQNELSKVSAREGLAAGITGRNELRRSEDNLALSNLIGGLTGAAQQGYSGYLQERRETSYEDYLSGRYGKDIPNGFKLPDNFTDMTQNQLYEFAINNDLNLEQLEELWYMARANAAGDSRGLGLGIPQLPGIRR